MKNLELYAMKSTETYRMAYANEEFLVLITSERVVRIPLVPELQVLDKTV